jgi:hypothetical protein
MNLGRLASATLMLSGAAAVAMPERVASAMSLAPAGKRGLAETRAGLGGTYAGLGAWAFVTNSRAARTAVGMTWLGAAAARVASMQLDQPEQDTTFMAFLATEVGMGVAALGSAAFSRDKKATKSTD